MKKLYTLLLLLVVFGYPTASSAQAQLPQLAFDHYAIYVKDMNVSATYYMQALGIKEMDCPIKDGRHRWFSLGNGQELHIIQGDNSGVKLEKDVHLALNTPDIKPFIEHLRRQNIPFWDWPGNPDKSNTRIDGPAQIYIQDPDGYWTEINDANR